MRLEITNVAAAKFVRTNSKDEPNADCSK